MSIFDSAINAATNAVDTAKNVFNSDGLASGLSGIGDKISGAVGDLGKGLNSFLGDLAKAPSPYPLPNILNNYATYTYRFKLGALSKNEVSFPDSTYKAGIIPQLILASGNAYPDNRVTTPYGKFDFFIDNLTLQQLVGQDKATGNTNATNIDFTVIEPYSMGLFMISCQTAAANAGFDNFRDAPFLLIVEFGGNTQTGISQTVPGITKYIPFKFTNISMKVTGKGSVYTVTGLPYNEQAFSKQVTNLRMDTTITGKTVQEVLQTGPNSLQAVINRKFKQLEKEKVVDQADQILIYFPQDIASSATPAASSGESKENDAGATVNNSSSTAAGGDLFTKLGVALSDKNSTLVQDSSQCNVIGQSDMGYNVSRKADTPVADGQKIQSKKHDGIEVRGKMSVDPEVSNFKFSQDTNIQNAINQVIMASKWPEKGLDSSNLTPEGMVGWWRIDAQVFPISSSTNTGTGTTAKLYVYRVIPFAAHASKVMPPGTGTPGFAKLKKKVVKEYNYLYTGKNQEILNFNIDIANGFQMMMLADLGNKSGDSKKQESDSGAKEKGADIDPKTGNAPPAPGQGMTSQRSFSGVRSSTDSKGGGGAETKSTRVARNFHDALMNAKDLVNLNLEIMGDPYFLATSGMGNYTASTIDQNLTSDGEVNWQSSEVHVVVNFRTPIDINQATGLYNFGASTAVQQFSGLYKVTTMTSTFTKGKFTQKLDGYRLQGQDDFRNATSSKLPTATPSKPEETPYGDPMPMGGNGVQTFDDGSSIQTFDDGSTLVTDSDGKVTSTEAPN